MKQRLMILVTAAILALAGLLPAMAGAADQDMTVLITGANRGLGLEFARQYLARGYHVIGTARQPGQAEELRGLGARVEQLDVADSASVHALGRRLKGTPIDILINNAGIIGHGARNFHELDFDELVDAFQVNSLGPMRVTQALYDNLMLHDTRKVIQISTMMASLQMDQGGAYGYRASKAALNMLNKTLALELGHEDFICVVLHPGWVRTDMGGPGAPLSPEQSVRGLIGVIDGLKPARNGHFMDYQGKELPW